MRTFSARGWLGVGLLAILGYYYAGEKIPINRGYGYDGGYYAEMVAAFPGWVDSYADSYRIQRVLPSVLCGLALRLLGIDPQPRAIVLAFVTLNALALVASFLCMLAIARTLRFEATRTIGLCASVFLSYGMVKLPSFHPVLTDFTAAALGSVMTLCYLRGWTLGLAACTLASAFTWPTLPLLGVLFLAFPYGTRLVLPIAVARGLRLFLPGALGIGFVALAVYIYASDHFPHWVFGPSRPMPYVSVVLALAYLVAGTFVVCRWAPAGETSFSTFVRGLPWKTISLAVVLVAGARVVQGLVATEDTVLNLPLFLIRIVACATERPLVFVVAHVVFLGPVFLVVLLSFARLCREAAAAGPAVHLALGAVVVFSLFSESRSFLPWWGPMCVFAVKAGGPWEDGRRVAGLVALQALGTQAWLPAGLFQPDSPIPEFPAQWYFMNFGPWMSDTAFEYLTVYVLAVACVLVAALSPWLQTRWPPRVKRLLAVGAYVAAALIGVEAMARLALGVSMSSAGEDPRRRYHPTLGWALQPGTDGVNADGFRGPIVPVGPRGAGHRVLLLGDAFVEAADLRDEETLRAKLAARVTGAEVLNAGVAAYSTDQELLCYRLKGRSYHPDVVVLAFAFDDVHGNGVARLGEGRKPRFVWTDDERLVLEEPAGGDGPVFAHRRYPRPHGWLPWRGSTALRTLSNFTLETAPTIHGALAAVGIVQATAVPAEMRVYGRRQEMGGSWRLTTELLRTLKEEVRADGGALVVLYTPASFEVDDGEWGRVRARYGMTGAQWSPTLVEERLQSVCGELGVTLVSLRRALAEARAAGEPPYDAGGVWTARGHDIAAQALAAVVSERSPPRSIPAE